MPGGSRSARWPTHLPDANPYALAIGAGTLVVAVVMMRWAPRLPAILVAIAAATAVVAAADWEERLPVVGAVPAGVPAPSLPGVRADDVLDLLGAGASVAILVFASSMLTATALARRDREPISARREFLGLAAASLGSGLLQGFPAAGSNSRSFVVADSRGRTQVANVAAGAFVVVTLLLLTPVFRYVPQAALGAVVLVAAVRMIDVPALRRLWRARRTDFVLAAVTMVGVLIVGVLPGIGVGVAVSLLEVLRRAVLPPTAVLGRVAGHQTWRGTEDHGQLRQEPGLLVFRFDAPLFFANADVLREQIVRLVDESDPPVRTVVLNAEGMVDMDITGAETLSALLDDLDERGVRLVMARVRTAVRTTMQRLGVEERLGAGEHPPDRPGGRTRRGRLRNHPRRVSRVGALPSIVGACQPRPCRAPTTRTGGHCCSPQRGAGAARADHVPRTGTPPHRHRAGSRRPGRTPRGHLLDGVGRGPLPGRRREPRARGRRRRLPDRRVHRDQRRLRRRSSRPPAT